MRLRSLEVADFRRIRRAKVELGAGLNVIYGPNDLGKSTLVEALRAALLLPSTSSYANTFAPWDRDAVPAVTLELEHGGVLFAVKKTWGSGARATSSLERADDGHTFSIDARQREVDGKLRELFQWGIASPGGKHAPKGWPESFLTAVLFGPQAKADELFDSSLEKDSDEAGRLRLTDALEAYAQDPIFKEILQRAQTKVEEAFSTNGKKRGGKASPFREPGEAVKEAQRALQVAEERLESARRAQEEAERLRDRLARCTEARDLARETLTQVEADAEATERRRSAERLLDEAQRAHAAHVAEQARAQTLRETLHEGTARAAERTTALEQAMVREKLARAALEEARATLRDVRGQDHDRERRVQELVSARKELVAKIELHEEVTRRAEAARDAKARAETSANAAKAAAAEVRKRVVAHEAAQAAVSRIEAALALVERRTLDRRIDALAEATRELDALAARVSTLDAELARPLPEAPTRATLDALRTLVSERAVAEAKVSVGLSLALRRLGDATVEASADGVPTSLEGKTLALDARRELRVKIGRVDEPLVELVVTGGASDARAELEAADRRLRESMTRAGLDRSLPPDEALARLSADVKAHEERQRAREEAVRLLRAEHTRLTALRAQRTEHDQLVERAASRGELELSPEVRTAAEAVLVDLGDDDPSNTLERSRREARAHEERARAALDESRRTNATASAQADVDAREATLKNDEVRAPEGDLATLRTNLTALDAQLAAMQRAASEASRIAEQAEVEARATHDAAELAISTTRHARDELERALAGERARLEELERSLARVDGSRLAEDVRAREKALADAPVPEQSVDADALEQARAVLAEAERATTEARERHLLFVGQLEASEGSVAIERHRDAREAHELALATEREVEVDFGAWKLLRDALRDAENAEGHHLGDVLAPKVAARMAELAKQTEAPTRYAGVRLDAHLRTEGVLAHGQTRDPKLLSVGTREQLALLLRLAVAEILKLPLVLDDHLTHTDPARSRWFRQTLRAAAHDTQIVVLTCHPDVYLDDADRPKERAFQDRAAGLLRAIDATRVIES